MTTFPKYVRGVGCTACPPRVDGSSDVAMVEIQGVYDGGLFYSCSCGQLLHRFDSDHYLYPRAQEVMQRWQDQRISPPF